MTLLAGYRHRAACEGRGELMLVCAAEFAAGSLAEIDEIALFLTEVGFYKSGNSADA